MATLGEMFNNNILSHSAAGGRDPLSEYEIMRQKNVAENKAMLDKLLADMKEDLPPMPSPSDSILRRNSSQNSAKRRRVNYEEDPSYSLRRNPTRSSRRPTTRSRAGVEGSSDDDDNCSDSDPNSFGRLFIRIGSRKNKKTIDWSDEENQSPSDRQRERRQRPALTPKTRAPPVGKTPEQITERDLKNVSQHATDKIYSQTSGSTCHQCRQKTVDQKTICRSGFCSGVRGQFCGPCLKNRYGEDAQIVLKDPVWSCPPCRGDCNCSICRNREGLPSTGILAPIAKRQGYQSVQSLLDHWKNTFKGFTEDGIKLTESRLKEIFEDTGEFDGFTVRTINTAAYRVKQLFILYMCGVKNTPEFPQPTPPEVSNQPTPPALNNQPTLPDLNNQPPPPEE